MKLEEGMYIRNEDGYILNLTKGNIYGYKSLIGNSNIKTKSHNIIDLIEVGDYVNGLPVTRICIDDETNEKYLNMFGSISEYGSEDIKSIVTKEQFDSMKYEVDSNE